MTDKQSLIDVLNTLLGGGGTLAASFAGRMMWHTNEVRKQRRKFFSMEMLWEAPVVVGMWIIGSGVGSYLKLGLEPTTALIAGLSYLGPRGAEVLFNRWFFKGEKGAE